MADDTKDDDVGKKAERTERIKKLMEGLFEEGFEVVAAPKPRYREENARDEELMKEVEKWIPEDPTAEPGAPGWIRRHLMDDKDRYTIDFDESSGTEECFVTVEHEGAPPKEIFRSGLLCCRPHTILAAVASAQSYRTRYRNPGKPNPKSKWLN